MKVSRYTEVSAVCSHPDHTGKGYAALLMRRVMRGILERGEAPFLHSRADTRGHQTLRATGIPATRGGSFRHFGPRVTRPHGNKFE
jgi:FR47-like protein